jgi:dTDP-4-dehydrorhamnose 3,5-epimerase
MYLTPLKVKESWVLEPTTYFDDRGFFHELFKESAYGFTVKQVNHSMSYIGTLRGIHVAPYPKLVTCVTGLIYDVVVDLRKDSPTYMMWEMVVLDGGNNMNSYGEHKQVFIPANCGHAFYAEQDSHVVYACGDEYAPKKELTYRWNDPKIGIKWPAEPKELSDKDKNAPFLE